MKTLHILIMVFSGIANCLASAPDQRELLGEPVGTVLIQGVAFGKGSNNQSQLFFATNGNPATFYAVDADTMEVAFSQPLPGLDVVWAIVRGSDENIYFAGTSRGHLYRYSPERQELQNLGHNGSDDDWVWDLVASNDGKIYGSTYPSAQVFEYNIETGTAEKWAANFTDQQYVRGIGVTDRHVYAGIGTRSHLFRIDRQDGRVEEIVVPGQGEPGSISKAWIYGGRIFVRSGRSGLYVLDEKTLTAARGKEGGKLSFNYSISPPSPHDPNLVYYKRGGELFCYHLAEDHVTQVLLPSPLPATTVRGWDWVTLRSGQTGERTVLMGLTEFGDLMQFDPMDGSLVVKHPQVEPQGVLIQSLEAGPDAKLYIGGYQAGMSVFDPASGKVEERYPAFNQPEGIGFLDGEVFFGTYGGARIFRLDPEKRREFGHSKKHNPGLAFTVGHHQDRPFAFASSEQKLFIGSVPGYGRAGGALTVFDRQADRWEVYPNLIENQSIIGLVHLKNKVYGSTSIFGGLGDKPLTDAAKLFVWDPATGKLVREWVPDIPGIDETPKAIGGLAVGPDGKLWGAAGGTIFVLDPETLHVERARTVHPSNWDVSHYWRPVHLRWAPDGRLFTTLGRQLTIVDPETLQTEIWDKSSLMTLHDGYVYYAKGAKLFRVRLD